MLLLLGLGPERIHGLITASRPQRQNTDITGCTGASRTDCDYALGQRGLV